MAIRKIMVVDDAATDRLHLERILIDAGYQVVTVGSGREALEKAGNDRPDLVFMDIVMDDMDGYQACRKLSAGETTRNIPVVIVSSKSQKVDRIWAQRQGARGYVTKPYTADDITRELSKFG